MPQKVSTHSINNCASSLQIPSTRNNYQNSNIPKNQTAQTLRDISKHLPTQQILLKEEDLPRTPIQLRKVEAHEFQELTPEQEAKMRIYLRDMIENTNFNSFYKAIEFLNNYLAQNHPQVLPRLEQAFEEIHFGCDSVEELEEKGGTCIDFSRGLQRILKEEGIHANLTYFYCNPGVFGSDAAKEYIYIGHSALLVPHTKDGMQYFTLLDPGLLIPEPIQFTLQDDTSNEVCVGNKCYQIIKDYEDKDLGPIYALQVRTKQNRNGKTSYRTIAIPFNPNYEWCNPEETIHKDILRGLGTFRYTSQDELGQNTGLISINIRRGDVTLKIPSLEYSPGETKTGEKVVISLDAFLDSKEEIFSENKKNLSNCAHVFLIACLYMQLDPKEMYSNIELIINNKDVILEEIWAPSVREEYKNKQ